LSQTHSVTVPFKGRWVAWPYDAFRGVRNRNGTHVKRPHHEELTQGTILIASLQILPGMTARFYGWPKNITLAGSAGKGISSSFLERPRRQLFYMPLHAAANSLHPPSSVERSDRMHSQATGSEFWGWLTEIGQCEIRYLSTGEFHANFASSAAPVLGGVLRLREFRIDFRFIRAKRWAAVWSEEGTFRRWLEVELAATEGVAERG